MTDKKGKKNKPADFFEYLLEDEFVEQMRDIENSAEYIIELKNLYPDHKDDIDLYTEVFSGLKNNKTQVIQEQKMKIWKKVLAQKTKERKLYFLRLAASFLLFCLLGGTALYFFMQEEMPSIEEFAVTHQPSFEKSQLILSDGQEIFISDYESSITYSDDGANVVINDTTNIEQEVKVDNFNQLIVPFGKYNSIQLSDGTNVWVNSGSRLVYPPVFVGKSREVYVQGEAYFEVARDAGKPFYVRTDRFRVEVLGTRFNVQANERDQLFAALLLEGEVSLNAGQGKPLRTKEAIRLQPGQIATIANDTRHFDVTAVQYPENYIAWKNGYLIFDEEPLKDVLQRVSRFYNIEIEFRKSLQILKLSGKLDLKDNPERVLNGVSAIARAKLSIEEGKYIIY